MERHLKHLNKREREFIDAVYIQLKTFKEASDLLGVGISEIQKLNKDFRQHLAARYKSQKQVESQKDRR